MRNAKTVLGIIRIAADTGEPVLRKAHARFGEGRMEKCSWSDSPAAFSTSITAARRGTSPRISPGYDVHRTAEWAYRFDQCWA